MAVLQGMEKEHYPSLVFSVVIYETTIYATR
jgi:hypothetical protein